jgi:hypothetical protein
MDDSFRQKGTDFLPLGSALVHVKLGQADTPRPRGRRHREWLVDIPPLQTGS